MSESFSQKIRSHDILSRFDKQTFSSLMPQSSADEAQHLCNRLQQVLEEDFNRIDGPNLALTCGLASFTHEMGETGLHLLARANAVF